MPGMMPYEDVHFQLVDLPAIASEHPVAWLQSTLQSADAALLVVDVSDPGCVEQIEDVHATLASRRVALSEHWEAPTTAPEDDAEQGDPFALRLPTLLVANKADRIDHIEVEVDALRELSAIRYPALAVSAVSGHGLDELGAELFRCLGIVRVYTKTPGHAPETTRPFTLRRGETVRDVARLVHRDLEHTVRYARVWGHSGFEGQHVGPDHVVADRDLIELHA
jgi:ribosome-interacting GTPase 1